MSGFSKPLTYHYEDEQLPDGTTLRQPVLDGPYCDFCLMGNGAIYGWHTIVDPEGIEGDQRIPCPRYEP